MNVSDSGLFCSSRDCENAGLQTLRIIAQVRESKPANPFSYPNLQRCWHEIEIFSDLQLWQVDSQPLVFHSALTEPFLVSNNKAFAFDWIQKPILYSWKISRLQWQALCRLFHPIIGNSSRALFVATSLMCMSSGTRTKDIHKKLCTILIFYILKYRWVKNNQGCVYSGDDEEVVFSL